MDKCCNPRYLISNWRCSCNGRNHIRVGSDSKSDRQSNTGDTSIICKRCGSSRARLEANPTLTRTFKTQMLSQSKQHWGSELVPACMNWHLNNPTSIYLSRLCTLLQEHARTPQDLLSVTLRQLNQTHEQKVLSEIQTKVTLKLLPIPRKWWRVQPHVADSRWSRAISKFRAMNAVLGNRYFYRTADTVCHDGWSVLECPLCFSGSNDEFHLLLKCRTMQ